jgi:hypothetical protein
LPTSISNEIDSYASSCFLLPPEQEIINSKDILKDLGSNDEDSEEAKMIYFKKFFNEYGGVSEK